MKLKDLIYAIIGYAEQVEDVHTVYEGSIYDLNSKEDVEYSAIVITQGEHREDPDADLFYARLSLFYVDREKDDNSNRLDIHSHSIDVLRDLLLYIEDLGFIVGPHSFDTFTERFQASCAGAFCTVEIGFPISDCPNGDYDNPYTRGTCRIQHKNLDARENGFYTIAPDDDYDALDSVNVSVNVPDWVRVEGNKIIFSRNTRVEGNRIIIDTEQD